jgi:hypothetical protein
LTENKLFEKDNDKPHLLSQPRWEVYQFKHRIELREAEVKKVRKCLCVKKESKLLRYPNYGGE